MKVFLLNLVDYVSHNSNQWYGNVSTLGNSKMAFVILAYGLAYDLEQNDDVYAHALAYEEFTGTISNDVQLYSRD